MYDSPLNYPISDSHNFFIHPLSKYVWNVSHWPRAMGSAVKKTNQLLCPQKAYILARKIKIKPAKQIYNVASSIDEFYEKKLSRKKWPIFDRQRKFFFFFFLKQMDILAVSNKIQKASSANF